MAESTGRTVEELLTGEKTAVTMDEFQMWATYHRVKAHYQETGRM